MPNPCTIELVTAMPDRRIILSVALAALGGLLGGAALEHWLAHPQPR